MNWGLFKGVSNIIGAGSFEDRFIMVSQGTITTVTQQ
jgi:hypothetical protein